jgi:ankyrin repeat protein
MSENKDDIDLEGWNLHRAAAANRTDIARSLIARGDNIEAQANEEETSLHCALMGVQSSSRFRINSLEP